MKDSLQNNECRLNYLGISSLMFSIFAVAGCWIPLFNILSISAAIMGLLLGAWAMVSLIIKNKKSIKSLALPLSGILAAVIAIITAIAMNRSAFSNHGGIKNFMTQVMDSMVNKNTNENNKSSSNNSKNSTTTESDNSGKNVNQPSKIYNIGETAEIQGIKVTLSGAEKHFSMNNDYSNPKSGSQFVKVEVKVENATQSDMTVSPYEFKAQDNQGAMESPVSATYLLEDQFESVTLIPGGYRSGSMIFELPENDDNLKLIYQPSAVKDLKFEFYLQ